MFLVLRISPVMILMVSLCFFTLGRAQDNVADSFDVCEKKLDQFDKKYQNLIVNYESDKVGDLQRREKSCLEFMRALYSHGKLTGAINLGDTGDHSEEKITGIPPLIFIEGCRPIAQEYIRDNCTRESSIEVEEFYMSVVDLHCSDRDIFSKYIPECRKE
jgi:hypothetical protein